MTDNSEQTQTENARQATSATAATSTAAAAAADGRAAAGGKRSRYKRNAIVCAVGPGESVQVLATLVFRDGVTVGEVNVAIVVVVVNCYLSCSCLFFF